MTVAVEKLPSFVWAVEQLRAGHLVARAGWERSAIRISHPGGAGDRMRFERLYATGKTTAYNPDAEDIRATDWEIVAGLQATT